MILPTAVIDLALDQAGGDLIVSWSSQSPPGALFQVYLDRRLVWQGRGRRCQAPLPAGGAGRVSRVDVVQVDPSDFNQDLSGQLPSSPGTSPWASLSWLGGTYLDPSGQDDIRGFRIYGSMRPGQPVDFTNLVGSVPAYPGGWVADGFGLGGFGQGGFGRSAGRYAWQSEPLASGVWSFAIVPYDHSGDERGVPTPASVTIQAPPRPPARGLDGGSLTYMYTGAASRVATLSWQPSPSA
ncbi:hypothetical protein EP7_005230 [Isosphaeraceae bacterium EP7]